MLEDKFLKYIKDNQLIDKDERVLLAVSGGVDSIVMLHLFAGAGYNLGVAHCNFQLRGHESDEDEVLAEEETKKLELPFYNRRFETKEEMDLTGESMEMAARRLRYDWFNELCTDEGYDVIAIAHHADDSIETFFINLMRGTGLKGLTGISVINGRIVRPLMFASRKEILEYAVSHKIHFREDSSNLSTKYLRNKIRIGIVPRLKEITPKFTTIMEKNIKKLTDVQLFINRAMEMIGAKVIDNQADESIIYPEKIDKALPLNFVIYELMSSNYDFKGSVVESLCGALENGATGKKFYSRDYVAYIDRGRIIVSLIKEDDDCMVLVEQDQTKAFCGNSTLHIEREDIDNVESLVQPETVALIDADKLTFPLTIRRWQEGDWFIPFGMTGKKKVSDYLVDNKISMAEKKRQFVLLNGDEIVWLIGQRVDDRYKIEEKTENVIRIDKKNI